MSSIVHYVGKVISLAPITVRDGEREEENLKAQERNNQSLERTEPSVEQMEGMFCRDHLLLLNKGMDRMEKYAHALHLLRPENEPCGLMLLFGHVIFRYCKTCSFMHANNI